MIFKGQAYSYTFNVGVDNLTWTVYVSKDGSDYQLTTNSTVTDRSQNGYTLNASAGDMNANIIAFLLVSSDISLTPYEISIVTDDPLTAVRISNLDNLDVKLSVLETTLDNHLDTIESKIDTIVTKLEMGTGSEVWTYTIYAEPTYTIPLEGCVIKVCESIDGTLPIGEQKSDAFGVTRWLVNRGVTYYVFRRMVGWKFNDPDTETIPEVGPLSIGKSAGSQDYVQFYANEFNSTSMPDSEVFNNVMNESIVSALSENNEYIIYPYRMYADEAKIKPLEDCIIMCTEDAEKEIVVGMQKTNNMGMTQWMLTKDKEYYFWRQKKDWIFDNPDIKKASFEDTNEEIDKEVLNEVYIDEFNSLDVPNEEKEPMMDDGLIDWEYKMYRDEAGQTPLRNCSIKMFTDVEGYNLVDEKITNKDGITKWRVKPGIYYIARKYKNKVFPGDPIQIKVEKELK